MNDEEIRSTIEQVKAQVKAKPENADKSEDEIDELILDGFYDEFSAGKMSKEDLEAIANAMGYELSDDFAADEGPADGEDAGDGEAIADISKEEAEELKVIEPGESKEDFKDKIEKAKEDAEPAPADDKGEDAAPASDDAEDDSDEDEEDIVADDDEEAQRAKASELFKMKF